ncbi:transcription factor myb3r-4 [Anaeramoeba flamelloides]|uniref:Transcription factor myb3r-4 n=1 Tax=Anaeramoeba flamelloides TaxID=1746091 RepID=A0ABQ8XG28_9EUKA|nr:transcription factor myb3r-4 [Anaeramoeba flamelloides]
MFDLLNFNFLNFLSTKISHKKKKKKRKKKKHKKRFALIKVTKNMIWSKEEDIILEKAVKKNKGKQWSKIATKLEKKDATQCIHRWQKVLNPKLKKGKWSTKEDQVLTKYVKKYGKLWSKIAKKIKHRTSKQCRERWNNILDPNIQKTPWTSDEDKVIIAKYEELGSKWSQMKQFLPGRSDNQIKNRWNSRLKKYILKNSKEKEKRKKIPIYDDFYLPIKNNNLKNQKTKIHQQGPQNKIGVHKHNNDKSNKILFDQGNHKDQFVFKKKEKNLKRKHKNLDVHAYSPNKKQFKNVCNVSPFDKLPTQDIYHVPNCFPLKMVSPIKQLSSLPSLDKMIMTNATHKFYNKEEGIHVNKEKIKENEKGQRGNKYKKKLSLINLKKIHNQSQEKSLGKSGDIGLKAKSLLSGTTTPKNTLSKRKINQNNQQKNNFENLSPNFFENQIDTPPTFLSNLDYLDIDIYPAFHDNYIQNYPNNFEFAPNTNWKRLYDNHYTDKRNLNTSDLNFLLNSSDLENNDTNSEQSTSPTYQKKNH